MEEKRYSYIYEITFPDGKVYVGKHTPKHKGENPNWYMGSGNYVKDFLKEHSKDELTKKLLVEGEFTTEELNKLEIEYVSKYKQLPNCVNKARGGDGGQVFWGTDMCSEKDRQKQRERAKQQWIKYKENYMNAAKLRGENYHLKFLKGEIDNSGENNGMYGKHHSEESKKKMSELHKGEKNSQYGTHWYTDGKTNVKAKECPLGFRHGRI